MNQNGTALVAVILIITTITALITTAWYSTQFTAELVPIRIRAHQEFGALEALLNYGVAVCRSNGDLLFNEMQSTEDPLDLQFSAWPVTESKCSFGQIYFTQFEHGILVSASLSCSSHALSCRVTPDEFNDPRDAWVHARVAHWAFVDEVVAS